MSRLFPHTAYAEDQPLAKTILYTHVLTRGFQAGSLVSIPITGVVWGYSRFISKAAPKLFGPMLLRSAGAGALLGVGLMTIAVPLRMRGREEIEWKDRAYRLLENKGQLGTDDWTYSAMAAALVPATLWAGKYAVKGSGLVGAGPVRVGSFLGTVGAVGIGSVVGMVGYMGYGSRAKGGKKDETVV